MAWYALGPFLVATILVVMAPGPVMAIVAHNTLRHGTAAGLLTVVGVELGELFLLAAALAGVTICAEFPVLFRWLGLAGILYLAWSSASALRPGASARARSTTAACARMPVVEGLMVAFANPATLVFYAAFFRQFLHPDHSVAQQTLALGAIYLVTAFAFDLLLVLAVARVRVSASWGRFGSVMRLGSAGMYLAIAGIGIAGFVRA